MFARATTNGPLFTHLLSSSPKRDPRDGAAATALSVMLHASGLTALVLATLTAGKIAPSLQRDTTIVYIAPSEPLAAMHTIAPPSPAGLPVPAPSMVLQPISPPPIEVGDIKAPTLSDIVGNPTTADFGAPGNSDTFGRTSGAGVTDERALHPFTVVEVAPRLRNRAEVERALQRNYPQILRDAGIGGSVIVWLFVDETGVVQKADLNRSSGHSVLDEAARKVAMTMRFSPAMNRDRAVKLWVSVPIEFTTR